MTRRTGVCADLVRSIAARTLEDPNVIVTVNVHSTDLPYDPIIGQFLRPVRINFVMRLRNLGERPVTKPGNQQAYRNPSDQDRSTSIQIQHGSILQSNQDNRAWVKTGFAFWSFRLTGNIHLTTSESKFHSICNLSYHHGHYAIFETSDGFIPQSKID